MISFYDAVPDLEYTLLQRVLSKNSQKMPHIRPATKNYLFPVFLIHLLEDVFILDTKSAIVIVLGNVHKT